MRRALAQGATGNLLTDAPASELAAAIRAVPQVIERSTRHSRPPRSPKGRARSQREYEVLAAEANHEIAGAVAARLHLSEGNYLSSAIRKLGRATDARRSSVRVRRLALAAPPSPGPRRPSSSVRRALAPGARPVRRGPQEGHTNRRDGPKRRARRSGGSDCVEPKMPDAPNYAERSSANS